MRRAILTVIGAILCACASPPSIVGPQAQPAPGVFRYIAGGDSRDDRASVMPWALEEAKARGATAFFFLGDMELTPQLDAKFARELSLVDPVRFYPALGNHEVKMFGFLGIGERAAEANFRSHFLGTARTPVTSALPDRVVYSADLPGGVHFVALDNVTAEGFGADQLAWLDRDLSVASGRRIIVGMHRPLARNGVTTHGMDQDGPQGRAESDAALAMFARSHVALILMSHEHMFAKLTQAGIESYITGGLGAPLALTSGAFHHFLQLDVGSNGIVVTVVKFDGTQVIESRANEGQDD